MPFTIPDNDEAAAADQARIYQSDIDAIVAATADTLVVSGCAVTAQGTPNMTVAVAAGYVRSAGTEFTIAAANATITTADATNPRLDLVTVNSSGAITVIAGTAAASPKEPALPSGSVMLAQVYVPANDTTIGSTQITDRRMLAPAFAPTKGPLLGNTFIVLGDSNAIGGTAYNGINTGDIWIGYGWASYFVWSSHNRLRMLYNAGVVADLSTQMLSRLQADVIDRKPSICIVQGPVNDSGGTSSPSRSALTAAQTIANLKEIIARLLAANILPILTTIMPSSATPPDAGVTLAQRQTRISQVNAWIARYAQDNNFPLLDFYSLLVDNATGGYKSAAPYTYNTGSYYVYGTTTSIGGDGLHPNTLGHRALANLVVNHLMPMLPFNYPFLTQSTKDTVSIVPSINGVSNYSSWTTFGTTANAPVTFTYTDINAPGQWITIAASATAVTAQTGAVSQATTGFAVGDKLAFAGTFTIDAETGSLAATVHMNFVTSGDVTISTATAIGAVTVDVAIGTWYVEAVVPATTAKINFRVYVEVPLAGRTGQGTFRVAQVTCVNLTALGLS